MELLERDSLLAELHEYYRAAVGGVGAMVFVSGEGGIGKTALTRRFCEGLPAETVVHRGFCDALGTPRALGPLYDISRTSLSALGPLLTTGHDRHTLFSAFLDLLGAGRSSPLSRMPIGLTRPRWTCCCLWPAGSSTYRAW